MRTNSMIVAVGVGILLQFAYAEESRMVFQGEAYVAKLDSGRAGVCLNIEVDKRQVIGANFIVAFPPAGQIRELQTDKSFTSEKTNKNTVCRMTRKLINTKDHASVYGTVDRICSFSSGSIDVEIKINIEKDIDFQWGYQNFREDICFVSSALKNANVEGVDAKDGTNLSGIFPFPFDKKKWGMGMTMKKCRITADTFAVDIVGTGNVDSTIQITHYGGSSIEIMSMPVSKYMGVKQSLKAGDSISWSYRIGFEKITK